MGGWRVCWIWREGLDCDGIGFWMGFACPWTALVIYVGSWRVLNCDGVGLERRWLSIIRAWLSIIRVSLLGYHYWYDYGNGLDIVISITMASLLVCLLNGLGTAIRYWVMGGV